MGYDVVSQGPTGGDLAAHLTKEKSLTGGSAHAQDGQDPSLIVAPGRELPAEEAFELCDVGIKALGQSLFHVDVQRLGCVGTARCHEQLVNETHAACQRPRPEAETSSDVFAV